MIGQYGHQRGLLVSLLQHDVFLCYNIWGDPKMRKGLLFAKRSFIFAKRTFIMAKTIY